MSTALKPKLPRTLQQLANGTGEPRELYLPEIRALCRLAKGPREPYPGLTWAAMDIAHRQGPGSDNAPDMFSTLYAAQLEQRAGRYAVAMMLSRPWSIYSRRALAATPKNIARTLVQFDRPAFDFASVDYVDGLPAALCEGIA